MKIRIECSNCGQEFPITSEQWVALGLRDLPRRCPACTDARQHRRPWNTVVEREQLGAWDGVLIALPEAWFETFTQRGEAHHDRPCRRCVIKGNRGQGVSWTGRIDVYDFRTSGGVGKVRLMRVEKGAGKPKPLARADRMEALADSLEADARDPSIDDEAAFVEVPPDVASRVAEIRLEARGLRASVDAETEAQIAREGALYHEEYEYLVIEDSELPEPTRALVFARVDYKTTMKGLGRQYDCSLDCAHAEHAIRLTSSCRSGRFGSQMAVALVSDDSPVVGRITGDVEEVRVWDLAHPRGARME